MLPPAVLPSEVTPGPDSRLSLVDSSIGGATSPLRKRSREDRGSGLGLGSEGSPPRPHTPLTHSSVCVQRGHLPPPNPPPAAATWLSNWRLLLQILLLHQLFAPSSLLPIRRTKKEGLKVRALAPLNFPMGKWPRPSRQKQRLQKEESSQTMPRKPHEKAQR